MPPCTNTLKHWFTFSRSGDQLQWSHHYASGGWNPRRSTGKPWRRKHLPMSWATRTSLQISPVIIHSVFPVAMCKVESERSNRELKTETWNYLPRIQNIFKNLVQQEGEKRGWLAVKSISYWLTCYSLPQKWGNKPIFTRISKCIFSERPQSLRAKLVCEP